jgi:hypothetical protein
MGIKNVADLVQLNPSYPDAQNPVRKSRLVVPFQVVRTNTTAVKVAVLPADATILGFQWFVQTPSNATTTAVVTLTGQGVGPTGQTFAFGSQSVLAAGSGWMNATTNILTGVFNLERAPATQTSGDIIVYATYSETGTASSAGGPFYFVIDYVR